jgi:hypothetical protein
VILTFRYRIKGNPGQPLAPMARAVNFVWNFCGENTGSLASAQQALAVRI